MCISCGASAAWADVFTGGADSLLRHWRRAAAGSRRMKGAGAFSAPGRFCPPRREVPSAFRAPHQLIAIPTSPAS